jgi:tetratricopeptide (TPR) repeat protein
VEVPSEGAFRPPARRAARHDLVRVPGADELVQALIEARLLVADGDGESAVVSVSHESLFRVWDRAREQLLAEGDLLRIHGRLRSRAQRWEDRGRRTDLLLQPGEELADGERLLRERFSLDPRELAFVDASRRRARAVAWGKRVALAAIVLFAGVAVVLGLSADRARREADASAEEARVQQRAAESRRVEAEANRREAERQRGVAEEVNRFLNEDLLGSVTQGADDVQLTVGQLLDRAAEKIEGRFDDRPEVEGRLRQTIGAAYYALGRMAESARHAERALALAEAVHGSESLAAADALELLALATRVDDERQFARAQAIRAALLGERHPLTLRVHGYLAMSQGDSLANPAWLDVLARVRAKGETREQVAEWARRLTLAVDVSWRERGRDETLALIATEAAPVTEHPQFGTSATWALAGYALRVAQDGLLDAGEAFATWAYEHGAKRHGRRNAHTRWALSVLTQILLQRGEPERTLPVLKAAYDLELEDADREAISVDVVTWYADALRRAGRPGEAVKVCDDVIQRVTPEGPLPFAARLVVLEAARALADMGEQAKLDALLARCADDTAAFVRARVEDREPTRTA